MTGLGRRCPKADDMHDALVAYLYADGDGAAVEEDEASARQHHRVVAHLEECAVCAEELESLRAVRHALGEWSPPEPRSRLQLLAAARPRPDRPAWRHWLRASGALAMAAVVVLLVGIAFAGVEVRYDADGVVVRIGTTTARDDTVEPVSLLSTEATTRRAGSNMPAPLPPTREARVGGGDPGQANTESDGQSRIRQSVGNSAGRAQADFVRLAPGDLLFDPTALDRLQRVIDANERRHQQELALWLTDFARQIDMQRLADQRRVQDKLGTLEQYADYLVRAADDGR